MESAAEISAQCLVDGCGARYIGSANVALQQHRAGRTNRGADLFHKFRPDRRIDSGIAQPTADVLQSPVIDRRSSHKFPVTCIDTIPRMTQTRQANVQVSVE